MIPWNRFEVYFLKIPFSPISSIDLPSDLIKFEDYIKKLLNFLWIRPVFTIIPLNSIHFYQIGKFGIIFDVIPREIDDLAVSSHQGGHAGPGGSMRMPVRGATWQEGWQVKGPPVSGPW